LTIPPILRSPERLDQVHALLTALQLRAWSHAVTIRVTTIEGGRELSWKTASGVLLEIGSIPAIATAWHVLEEWQKVRDGGGEVALVCDNMPILVPRTVFRDEAADLALIEVPRASRAGLRAIPYRPGRHWPPPVVRPGETVLLTGFPKLLRADGEVILHGDFNLVSDVSAVGDRHFTLQIEWDRIINAGRVTLPWGEADYAGVSGGPVFLSDGGVNELVGVISEAAPTLPLWRVASLAVVPADHAYAAEPI
jgi:hypothetical protein